MGAIVIRTRYDEGTESAEVATSDCDGIATEKQVLEASSSLLRAWRI